MFAPAVERDLRDAAEAAGADPAAFVAAAHVESGGVAEAVIDGHVTAPIQYEFHVFHRQLPPALRPRAIGLGLASSRWGQLSYPRSQRERHVLLERAKLLDPEAAYAACAWGVGRVLGEHAVELGYDSAEALAREAMAGVQGQARVMLRHIRNRDLLEPLNARDWRRYAIGYCGPLRKRVDYAARLAAACARYDRPVRLHVVGPATSLTGSDVR